MEAEGHVGVGQGVEDGGGYGREETDEGMSKEGERGPGKDCKSNQATEARCDFQGRTCVGE